MNPAALIALPCRHNHLCGPVRLPGGLQWGCHPPAPLIVGSRSSTLIQTTRSEKEEQYARSPFCFLRLRFQLLTEQPGISRVPARELLGRAHGARHMCRAKRPEPHLDVAHGRAKVVVMFKPVTSVYHTCHHARPEGIQDDIHEKSLWVTSYVILHMFSDSLIWKRGRRNGITKNGARVMRF